MLGRAGMSSDRGAVPIASVFLALAVILVIATVVLAAFLVLRHGSDDNLTIYSSLPLRGPDGTDGQVADMVHAIDLALEQKHHKAGRFTVKHVSLDDSTPDPGGFTAAATANNARAAAEDDHTAGYIGDFNSGASAISIPILSVAKVPQLSPASTAVGLTTAAGDERGSADPSEPETYYYDGYRNFVRVVPRDSVQADAITGLLLDDHCRRVAMINDGGYYGVRLAREIRLFGRQRRLKLVFDKTIGTRASRLPQLAAAKHPDCFMYSGARDDRTVDLFTGVAHLSPQARLYGGDGLAETAFTTHIDQATADRVHMTLPARDRGELGRAFVTAYKARFNRDEPEPYAVYAYESTMLLLDAIGRSKTGKREDIVRALFQTSGRASAIGTYTIDDNGDTDATSYDLYKIANRGLHFDRTINDH